MIASKTTCIHLKTNNKNSMHHNYPANTRQKNNMQIGLIVLPSKRIKQKLIKY